MLIGYARTSTVEQQAGFDAQIAELKKTGCERIFQEQVSSVAVRPQLDAAIDFSREKGAPAAWDGARSAVEGVEGIPEGGGEKRNAGGPPAASFSGSVRCQWCEQEVPRQRRLQKFYKRSCRVAAWQAATGYKRRTLNPPAQPAARGRRPRVRTHNQ
jgi:hypothetical protein